MLGTLFLMFAYMVTNTHGLVCAELTVPVLCTAHEAVPPY